jgi:prephenate dehydratase
MAPALELAAAESKGAKLQICAEIAVEIAFCRAQNDHTLVAVAAVEAHKHALDASTGQNAKTLQHHGRGAEHTQCEGGRGFRAGDTRNNNVPKQLGP